ncbi:MAG TPA: hypothetical protein VNW30_09085 [Opitutaceae bacterium]|jgi:hypothetical protein|nr:hypothetical protein [Opitutaceae bacterium]
MKILDFKHFDDCVVLHFDTEGKQINAYTLASTLVALADAAKAANDTINPGYDVEVVVEAFGPGSFRAKLRAVYRKHHNLFSQQIALALVISILGNYIYERTLAARSDVKIQINTDEVIIERGDEKIIVPRKVYDATRQVEKEPRFVNAITRTFQAIERDPDIKGIGLVKDLGDPAPEIVISRETISQLALQPVPEPDTRIVTEVVDLQIIKAILERGARKWEFMWRGVKIGAAITHQAFYDSFDAHRITIAPGDILRARLAIAQQRDPKMGIYSNIGYEVTEVFEHVPRLKQVELPKHE